MKKEGKSQANTNSTEEKTKYLKHAPDPHGRTDNQLDSDTEQDT